MSQQAGVDAMHRESKKRTVKHVFLFGPRPRTSFDNYHCHIVSYIKQCSKWKFRSVGILFKRETRICRKKNRSRMINGCSTVPVLNSGTKRSSGMVYEHIPAHFELWPEGISRPNLTLCVCIAANSEQIKNAGRSACIVDHFETCYTGTCCMNFASSCDLYEFLLVLCIKWTHNGKVVPIIRHQVSCFYVSDRVLGSCTN
jgi:hypothetical protein